MEKPLRVAVHAHDVQPLFTPDDSVERFRFALQAVDRARLFAVFIDGENDTAIERSSSIGRCRREEDHHRALDAILLRHQAPPLHIFPRQTRS